MGSFANSLFTLMLGWIQTLASAIWQAASTAHLSPFWQWIQEHWKLLAVVVCCLGVVADFLIYLFRWKPYKVWHDRLGPSPDLSISAEGQAEPGSRSAGDLPEIQPPQPGRLFEAQPSEVDFSPWETTSAVSRKTDASNELTPAGYTVAADSPYRRPATVPAETKAAEEREEHPSLDQLEQSLRRSRRRVRAGGLFSGQESDVYEAELPQRLIDRRTAYGKPVYPSKWHTSEDEET